jgi:hypothetical protein
MGPSPNAGLEYPLAQQVGRPRPSRDSHTSGMSQPRPDRLIHLHTAGRPTPGSGPAGGGVGRSWSDLVDDRWQDLLGRLEAAANEIEEIELPLERRPMP